MNRLSSTKITVYSAILAMHLGIVFIIGNLLLTSPTNVVYTSTTDSVIVVKVVENEP